MAYNPFNFFRRNQKTLFAILTVFIMIMFTLSSGLGGGADFFDWLPQWLGRKAGKRGEHLCTIDGRKIYDSHLQELNVDRIMANRFMSLAARQTVATLEAAVRELSGRLSPEARSILQQAAQQEQFIFLFAGNPQLADQVPLLIEQLKADIGRILNLPNVRSEDREAARAKIAALSLMIHTGDHYFLNAPNRNYRDLVDFMLWQRKADQLGIYLTSADVSRLIQQEFYGYFRSDVQVRRELQQQMVSFNMERCLEAIGEEFRVRLAQTALLGGTGTLGDRQAGGFPAFPTTYELFDFYRDQCSPTTLAAIPVPADNFLDRVTDLPGEDELRRFFERHKETEFNPTRETPGFKEPRKARIAFFAVTGEEPYYQKWAQELLAKGELHAKVGSLLTVPLPGTGPAWVAGALGPTVGGELLLHKAYERTVQEHRFTLFDRYSSTDVTVDRLLPQSIVRPGTLAGAAGTVGAQLLGGGHPAALAATLVGPPIAYELRDRIQVGMPLVLGSVPTPGLLPRLVAAEATARQATPAPLPLEALRPELSRRLVRETAHKLAFGEGAAPIPELPATRVGDVQKFIDEMRKLSNDGRIRPSQKDKIAEIEKYVQEFAAARGLTVVTLREPRNEWTLEEAPELAPLVAAQREAVRRAAGFHGGVTYEPFGRSFFWRDAARREPLTTIYWPRYYPEERPNLQRRSGDAPEPVFVVWRLDEQPARVPTYSEARPAVIAAWKRLEARKIARREAERLAAAIRANPQTSEKTLKYVVDDERLKFAAGFTDPAARARIRPFLIEGVAPLTTIANPTAQPLFPLVPTLPGPLQPFRIVPSENVKYPAPTMAATLLEQRKQPPKTVFLLTDEPTDTVYVVVVLQRDVRTLNEFETSVARARPGDNTRAVVLASFSNHIRQRAAESVLTLLKREFRYEETEEQKKKLDEGRRRRDET